VAVIVAFYRGNAEAEKPGRSEKREAIVLQVGEAESNNLAGYKLPYQGHFNACNHPHAHGYARGKAGNSSGGR
jgi:hypothetical protein